MSEEDQMSSSLKFPECGTAHWRAAVNRHRGWGEPPCEADLIRQREYHQALRQRNRSAVPTFFREKTAA